MTSAALSANLRAPIERPGTADTARARHRRLELQCTQDLTEQFTLAEALQILADPMRDRRYLQTALGPDIDRHLAHLKLGRMSPITLDAKERILARLAVAVPDVDVAELAYEHLERHLITIPEGSWRTHRSHINQFVKWAIKFDRRTAKNPVDLLPELRPGTRRVLHVFDERERQVIIAASTHLDDPARDRVRAHLLLDAGIRKAEARGLQHRNVDAARREITVLGKGGKERVIPVAGDFWLAWEDALLTPIPREERLPAPADYVWFPMRVAGAYGKRERQVTRAYPERPMSQRGFHEWWERLLAHTNVDYRKPHMTRHSYATAALDASDGDIYGVKELLGHAKIATTELYLHSSKVRKESVVKALARARRDAESPDRSEQ